MAGTNSDYTENKVVDHTLGTTAWTMPAAVSLGLFTTNPNFETGASGTEASGGGYARLAIAFNPSVGGATSNTASHVWTVGTDIAAGTYTGWGVFDAASGGNLLFGDTFGAGKVLTTAGDTLTFAIGAVTYSLT
jgi:predicted 2-oxoglutarate/Fe(II)-dependent dioxygenase YbiX